jgi:hypothetical protein
MRANESANLCLPDELADRRKRDDKTGEYHKCMAATLSQGQQTYAV